MTFQIANEIASEFDLFSRSVVANKNSDDGLLLLCDALVSPLTSFIIVRFDPAKLKFN